MALSFHLVKRPDMRKDAAEGSKLFYAQVRSLKKLDFNKLCDLIAVRSTAFIGDVMLVIEGLLSVMEERLEEGDVIQMGRLGNFRMVAGSKGIENEKDFNVSLFNKARIVFSPGTMLNEIRKNAKYEKMDIETVTPPTGGGSDRRKSSSNVSIIRYVKTGIYQTISFPRSKSGGMFRNQSGCHPRPIGHRNRLGRKYAGKGA